MQGSMEVQQRTEGGETLMVEMPSFRSISGDQECPKLLLLGRLHEVDDAGRPADGGDDDFEFASVFHDSLALHGFEPVAADDIFSGGRIRAAYPRALDFGARQDDGRGGVDDTGDEDGATGEAGKPIDLSLSFRWLMAGDGGYTSTSSSSSSSSSSASSESSSYELDEVPTESYCVWVPRSAPASPERRKKSHSSGGSSAAFKKWRLRNLVAGRSHSDGKDKSLFVAAPDSSATAEAKEKKGKNKGQQQPPGQAGRGGGKVASESDMAAAHRLYYTKGGAAAGDRRRSFLPYRKDLLGFFANFSVAGR